MAVLLSLSLSAVGHAQATERVSVGVGGIQGNQNATADFRHTVSSDGRFVVFESNASNIVSGDANLASDLFVRDRLTGSIELVSVNSVGQQGDGASGYSDESAISGDGRFVAFDSYATNLVPGDTNGCPDVFVHDRLSGATQRVSVSSMGVQGNNWSNMVAMTPDGRCVVFTSRATNLVPGDVNNSDDVFIHDLQTGATELVSLDSNGVQGDQQSLGGLPSSDGRFVAFSSYATNLVAGDTNGSCDVFVRDLISGTTRRVSVDSSGIQGSSWSGEAGISADGRFIAFTSAAPNLTAGDTNGVEDVFVHDLSAGITERVSVSTQGGQGFGDSIGTSISEDGRFVSFLSYATNLVSGDTNGVADVFLRDRLVGTTERISLATDGAQANAISAGGWLTPDNRYAVFWSNATNLCAGDTNGVRDVFLRDRFASGFTSLCDPGLSGVLNCPCSNPPSAAGRGCDNSAATGGASLAASGIAYLSIDSLVFTTADERPNSTSVLVEGTAPVSTGIVFGQGVRCLGGTLKRLYVKTAINGSITAPQFAVGDLSVSARSAQLGLPIQAGQPYYFLVAYRDPVVPGGCPASSTFNATQTGVVTYWP